MQSITQSRVWSLKAESGRSEQCLITQNALWSLRVEVWSLKLWLLKVESARLLKVKSDLKAKSDIWLKVKSDRSKATKCSHCWCHAIDSMSCQFQAYSFHTVFTGMIRYISILTSKLKETRWLISSPHYTVFIVTCKARSRKRNNQAMLWGVCQGDKEEGPERTHLAVHIIPHGSQAAAVLT